MTRFALVLAFSAGLAAATEPPSKVVEKTLPLAPDGRFVLETYKGRVAVSTWDRAEVSVRAVVKPDGECDDAAELVEKTRVRIEGGGREVRVVSDYDALPKVTFRFRDDCGNRPFVGYEVRLPRTAAVEIADYKSRIAIDGLAGDLELESYKGVMRLKGLSGRLDLETYKGDARVELERVAAGLRLETYKGEIDVVVPKGTQVELAEKVGRRGLLEASLSGTRSGPRLSVETYKGTVRVRER